jgi:DNA-directed RNA polymerase subunit E'/Rpb7
MIKIIKQQVSIECKFLDSEIKTHVLSKLVNKMVGCWTLDYGYILDVKRVISLGKCYINPATSSTTIEVTYEIDTLKPEKDLVLNGTVCMIFNNGLFVDIYEKMKVLIPSNSMNKIQGLEYNDSLKTFSNSEKTIGENDFVQIKLTSVQYTDKKYICIGILI